MINRNTILESADVVASHLGQHPGGIGIILGSGFADWIKTTEVISSIPYRDIPGFPVTSVVGHAGMFSHCQTNNTSVLVMQGRFHFYEGHPIQTIALPIRVMKQLGINKLIVTNAAGGINVAYCPGDLMLISDHINLSGQNPLIGPNDDYFGPRFPDSGNIYPANLRAIAAKLSQNHGLTVHEGTYLYTAGPNYETPAEIRMMRSLGADVVGMSTVPEALVAHHTDIRILGISLISNLAAGMTDETLNHDEVMATMALNQDNVFRWINDVIVAWRNAQE